MYLPHVVDIVAERSRGSVRLQQPTQRHFAMIGFTSVTSNSRKRVMRNEYSSEIRGNVRRRDVSRNSAGYSKKRGPTRDLTVVSKNHSFGSRDHGPIIDPDGDPLASEGSAAGGIHETEQSIPRDHQETAEKHEKSVGLRTVRVSQETFHRLL